MRGFFGRPRVDKPQASLVFDSYDTALYPPRAYRCHTMEGGMLETDPNTVMLPSIDADSICKPLAQDNHSQNRNQKKPGLREYWKCFATVPPATTALIGSQESLNLFHYPELCPETEIARVATDLGLPPELLSVNRQGTLDAPQRARIRLIPRSRPPRPTRRGAKVTVSSEAERGVRYPQKRPREKDEGDGDDLHKSDEDGEEGGESDEGGSVNFEADDDDDRCSDGFESDNNDMTI